MIGQFQFIIAKKFTAFSNLRVFIMPATNLMVRNFFSILMKGLKTSQLVHYIVLALSDILVHNFSASSFIFSWLVHH